jgi:hypothetical protein
MTSKLNIAVAVWRNGIDNELYAFPLSNPWGEPAYPAIDDGQWVFEGVLQPGTSVAEVRPASGTLVRARGGRGQQATIRPLFAVVPYR